LGVEKEGCSEGGHDIGHIEDGNYAVYNNIDLTDATVFMARVAGQGSGGRIEVHLDSATGQMIGTCSISSTGDWQKWATQSCPIDSTPGKHTVCLVFSRGGFNLEWFAFHNGLPAD